MEIYNHTKVAFITAIYGNYEKTCKSFEKQTIPADFFCFTDDMNIESNGWIIDTTPYHSLFKSKIDDDTFTNSLNYNSHTFNIAKYYKQNFYKIPILEHYDYIIWLDGTIQITNSECAEYIVKVMANNVVCSFEHELRNGSLQNEAFESMYGTRYNSNFMNNQYQPVQRVDLQYFDYINQGYNEEFWKQINSNRKHFGVWVTCLVGFNMRHSNIIQFLDFWYFQTLRYTTQDQVGFSFACQKLGIIPYTFPDEHIGGNGHSKTDFYIKQEHFQ